MRVDRARGLRAVLGRIGPFALVGLASLVLTGCGPRGLGPAAFPAEGCRVVALRDGRDGALIGGAEDLVWHRGSGMLLVSAYDRLAVAEALAAGTVPPSGGLYGVELAALSSGGAAVARRLIEPDALAGGLRPHGIALAGDRLAVVNRRWFAGTTLAPVVQTFRLDGARVRLGSTVGGAALCAANDLAFVPDGLAVSLDRGHCPGWSVLERVLGVARARVIELALPARSAPQVLNAAEHMATRLTGLALANGVARLPNGALAVAETRAKRVVIDDAGKRRRLRLPGAPDNLTVADDGRLVAALSPNLIGFARYRYGHSPRTGSRVIALDPDTGAIQRLFEDPSGQRFPGATVAVVVGQSLIAGSVRAQGLLVCEGNR